MPTGGRLFYRRLNFNICFNLALLLAAAMLLIHFVSMGMAQRQMIRIKTTEGMLLIQAIGQALQSPEGDRKSVV